MKLFFLLFIFPIGNGYSSASACIINRIIPFQDLCLISHTHIIHNDAEGSHRPPLFFSYPLSILDKSIFDRVYIFMYIYEIYMKFLRVYEILETHFCATCLSHLILYFSMS